MHNRPARTLSILALAGAALLFSSTSALARYTAIDQVPELDSNGQPVLGDDGYPIYHSVQISFEGYCDTTVSIGEECDQTYALPYSAIFGGQETNQVLLRDDGRLDFVFGPPSDLSQFPTDEELTNRFQVLASFDSGIRGQSSPQLGAFQLQGSSFLATWFICPSPGITCRTSRHTALFTPGARGFQVAFTDLSGGVHTTVLEAGFNPPLSSPTPEPTTWAMMILGFGLAGSMLRSARRRQILNGRVSSVVASVER